MNLAVGAMVYLPISANATVDRGLAISKHGGDRDIISTSSNSSSMIVALGGEVSDTALAVEAEGEPLSGVVLEANGFVVVIIESREEGASRRKLHSSPRF
jgi:hypothetical protein